MLLLVSTFNHQVLWLKNKIILNSITTFTALFTAFRSQLYLSRLSLAVDATVEDFSRLRSLQRWQPGLANSAPIIRRNSNLQVTELKIILICLSLKLNISCL